MQCAFQIVFLNFYIDVQLYIIFEKAPSPSQYLQYAEEFSLIHLLFLFQAEEGKAEAAAAGPRQRCGRCPTLQRTVPPA